MDPASTAKYSSLPAFTHVLHQHGVYAALGYLNRGTTHRYTGVFRFAGQHSRNLVLFDRYDAQVRQGAQVPLAEAFCALVGRQRESLQILNALADPRAQQINTLVTSYCGVPIYDAQGQLYGTLCHYDFSLCQESPLNLQLLEAAAPLLYAALTTSHS
ncbi:GAF domain-containing protein [Hymenobacter sp. GOD-10R]|uniref:GAF domain-containing protein n=1 Tax=Hymenobacter sp. GOD-10R TaxID=3093922 RepID=UPI002D765443|nr:GAF domain-containing protein [Hymenobacter sp. GOD-10R]WRQ31645.1 GAF domain-containing protein [Hymenobacter sp. GOD-10R]